MRAEDILQFPAIGTDSVTKGTFILEHATLLFDFDEDEYELKNTRATGGVLIEGYNNPLFDAVKEHPLRVQGLIASVMFGAEKKFIRFQQISDYNIIDDGIIKEIDFTLVFEILDNLAYLEQVIEYKDEHKL